MSSWVQAKRDGSSVLKVAGRRYYALPSCSFTCPFTYSVELLEEAKVTPPVEVVAVVSEPVSQR